MKILRLNWGELEEERPDWSPGSGHLYAIWPSPVDHDVCFEAAGFEDFADSDGAWDDDFADLVQRLIHALGGARVAVLAAGEYPVDGWRRRRSLRDALIGAARDDGFGPCVVHFGEPATAAVRTSDGHPILWTWMAEPSIDRILGAVAQGRPVKRMDMNWEKLA